MTTEIKQADIMKWNLTVIITRRKMINLCCTSRQRNKSLLSDSRNRAHSEDIILCGSGLTIPLSVMPSQRARVVLLEYTNCARSCRRTRTEMNCGGNINGFVRTVIAWYHLKNCSAHPEVAVKPCGCCLTRCAPSYAQSQVQR